MPGLRKFWSAKGGNFSILTAVSLTPLLLSVGLSVDYARYVSAQKQLQEIADAVSIGLASTKETSTADLLKDAGNIISGNTNEGRIKNVKIAKLDSNSDKVDIDLEADLDVTFMRIAGYSKLDVKAHSTAERAIVGNVEVSLVLDNTWSMSETDGSGVSKIGSLKTAASSLVKKLLEDSGGSVKIGLVPYADYVNVGTQYRYASWLSVPADYSVDPKPKVCETKTTKSVCVTKAPTYACTKVVDGVEEAATCGGGCTEYETQTVPPYQSCTGGGSATHYKWWGCVGSRMTGKTRLDDGSPSVTYPGYVETSQKCLNPITDLSSDKNSLLAAVNAMVINIGSYKPYTYIPAGLIWGFNMLSPTAPLDSALAYDSKNQKPRKVLVLMTDGENTLRFVASTGRHSQPSGSATAQASQMKTTNDDTLTICKNIKAKEIELYTVAFMVDDADAKSLLESCATDKDHYYDASDTSKLLDAFSGIADSLRVVRLTR